MGPASVYSHTWMPDVLRTSESLGPILSKWVLICFEFHHGSLNVPIEHHPTIRYMVYNGYYKVMSNIPKMGQLPTPVHSNRNATLRWDEPWSLLCLSFRKSKHVSMFDRHPKRLRKHDHKSGQLLNDKFQTQFAASKWHFPFTTIPSAGPSWCPHQNGLFVRGINSPCSNPQLSSYIVDDLSCDILFISSKRFLCLSCHIPFAYVCVYI